MSIFDRIRTRYNLNSDQDIPEKPSRVDHIIKDGIAIDILDKNVSMADIVMFFKSRMPYARFQIKKETDEMTELEAIKAKRDVFNGLIEIYEQILEMWNGIAYEGPRISPALLEEIEYQKDGNTYH